VATGAAVPEAEAEAVAEAVAETVSVADPEGTADPPAEALPKTVNLSPAPQGCLSSPVQGMLQSASLVLVVGILLPQTNHKSQVSHQNRSMFTNALHAYSKRGFTYSTP
jgi:hypothetical protein